MWIASTLGFFSIVAHRDQKTHLLVRARQRQDLVNLINLIEPFWDEGPKIIELPEAEADYRFRILLERECFEQLLAYLSDEIQYDNFKSAIQRLPDQRAKAPAYHHLWADLRRLQPADFAGN